MDQQLIDRYMDRVWGLFLFGGGGPADETGLKLHVWARELGYKEAFKRCANAAKAFGCRHVIYKNVWGNYAGRDMSLFERDRILPLRPYRDAVMADIAAGIEATRQIFGEFPYIYAGGFKHPAWTRMPLGELYRAVSEHLACFRGCPIIFDDVRTGGIAAEAMFDLLESDGWALNFEPPPVRGDNWAFTTYGSFITGRHLSAIEAGKSKDAQGVPIPWMPMDECNGPRTLLGEWDVEPTLDHVAARIIEGYRVALGCYSGGWKPENKGVPLTALAIARHAAVMDQGIQAGDEMANSAVSPAGGLSGGSSGGGE